MLAGMVLHIGEAEIPVQFPPDLTAGLQGLQPFPAAADGMRNDPVPDLYIHDPSASQHAPVGGLAALFRKEEGPVQDQSAGPLFHGARINDLSREGEIIRSVVI